MGGAVVESEPATVSISVSAGPWSVSDVLHKVDRSNSPPSRGAGLCSNWPATAYAPSGILSRSARTREALREQQFAVERARIGKARRPAAAVRLELHWQHQVNVARAEPQDLARYVALVQALHDYHDRGAPGR
ncbi:hypothetical protein ABID82_003237 [Methylobacterium sp. PvP062]|uniref:Uncharacterized protein n=1 Tax=Methylobacterium radiotolerans TaxID=31998 RepID=A0ABV2NC45_9HYPH|nr:MULTISPECIES: hypothetical protein [unclassified Methylobacterium]MBP2492727.1 hypothetical protein [Methylobacterium sp. PvP105]MBP2500901.1 hypothetical protein [Methylobacterium sp. PvP109]GEM95461.1 hypothetical protein MRA01_00010 [Methylobacterium radiotolerans]